MFSAVPSNPIISTDSSKRPLDNDFLYPDHITTDGRQNDRMIAADKKQDRMIPMSEQ